MCMCIAITDPQEMFNVINEIVGDTVKAREVLNVSRQYCGGDVFSEAAELAQEIHMDESPDCDCEACNDWWEMFHEMHGDDICEDCGGQMEIIPLAKLVKQDKSKGKRKKAGSKKATGKAKRPTGSESGGRIEVNK